MSQSLHSITASPVPFILTTDKKEEFLGGAAALLMPIGWPEPFGLVVIEAMACGTPVIAFPFGSMPELIEPGVNGALVESVDQAVAAVEALVALDRTLCRPALHHGAHGQELRHRPRVQGRPWSRPVPWCSSH
jgi:glycosyltransferase involved in cell wall biosynthesis